VRGRLPILAATAVAAAALAAPAGASAFGFLPGAEGFSTAATKPGGAVATAAGSHPYAFEAAVGFDGSGGDPREVTIALPPGFLVNPTAIGECSDTAFHTPRSASKPGSLSGESCPNTSQVGVVEVRKGGTTRWFDICPNRQRATVQMEGHNATGLQGLGAMAPA
jgi:hypothetical protein